jgi:hypothetical protein
MRYPIWKLKPDSIDAVRYWRTERSEVYSTLSDIERLCLTEFVDFVIINRREQMRLFQGEETAIASSLRSIGSLVV